MEGQFIDDTPCSSIAIESILRGGTAGLLWGLCAGPYEANKSGLTGFARASFVAKSVGQFGFQCGLFAGIFSITRCGLQRYRRKNDWLQVNALVAGAVAGAAVGVGTRNWKQAAGMAGVASAFVTVASNSNTN
ncbi:unnamed protein product [Ilex paraguariensis]|uniref:Outer envelope pore protein 16-4, chloroplastic n=1 Tax=Ilex paraguariensis TaxID=185542 RepID=A0ABC8U0P0_9AQUA